jgi:UDP-N-acetyl-D-glucosamine dehydrogenase
MSSADAVARFREGDWTGGVVGLGYVGLQVAVAIVDAGLTCIGYDVQATLIRRLTNGHAHVDDVSDRDLKRALENGLTVTDDWRALIGVDALFICVPSPVPMVAAVDETHLHDVADLIRRVVRRGVLISVETTVYPGATEKIILPAALEDGRRIDREVFVAVCPERLNPGSLLRLVEIPRIVGGVSRASGEVAAAAYHRFVSKVHTLSSARAAEMTKLVENAYRAVNIGYVNEVARIANSLSIDIGKSFKAQRRSHSVITRSILGRARAGTASR